ncbi:MAG: efflux RND transporter permease subunit [Planctomycetota bacterium]
MIAFFAKHPTAANLLMAGLVAIGLLSVGQIRRETLPDFRPREVSISVPYPGATAEDVEEGVNQRIEDALDGVRFVEEVRSDARENLGLVTVEMVDGGDWLAFKDEIDTAIAAIDDFPDQAEEPVVEELYTTDSVMTVIVAGQMSPGDLKLYAEDLKDRMQEVPGVSLVEVDGFSDHQLRVELDFKALIRHNLSPADVAAAIRRQSLDIPAGIVEAPGQEVLVRYTEERQTPDELGDLVVVGSESGAEIRLRDLGKLVDDFQLAEDKAVLYLSPDTDSTEGQTAGQRAALLRIKKTDSEDSLDIAEVVNGFLRKERQRNPTVDLIVTQDQSTLIADRLGLLLTNGWQGMLLVFAMMWLFFNFKLSIWVVASLPISFLDAFSFLPPFDLTINMLTMVGLLLGIGILMDDGIVIAENIAAQHEKGKKPLDAAVAGVTEVGGGVISSFLTTVCMLGPLAFLSGNIGRVLEVVPIVLLLVLSVSLIEAFMILPSHLGHSLHDGEKTNSIRRRIDSLFDWTKENLLGSSIDRLVRVPYLWLGCVVGVFLMAIALPAGGLLKFKALPEIDGDTAVARVLMPQGTSLERTERIVGQLVSAIEQINEELTPDQPEGQPLVETVYARFNENADAFESGPHVATVYADLLTAEARSIGLDALFERWRETAGQIPDAIAVNFTDPGVAPTGRNIEVRARGRDLEELRQVSLELKQWLGRFDGIENLTSDLRPGKTEYRIRFRPGVLGIELDSARMANQLRAAFQGEEADEIQVGSESYEIEARFNEESQDSVSDLLRFRFTLPDGSQVPLSAVATVSESRGWGRIARVDRLRTATLRGDVDGRKANTAAVLNQLEADFLPQLRERYPNASFELEGETAEAAQTASSLLRGLLIGLIGVFILLSFQFRSYIEPVIVMAAIPFSLIGVIVGHLLLGYPLTMPSMLGFVSLAGVVVNDSILLVLFLKQARAEGRDPVEAAGQASRDRFRAILITSLTTMAGLIPLTFETSAQAIILIPLAISIVFGMFAATVLVLLVIPCMYVMLNDLGLTANIKADDSPEHT